MAQVAENTYKPLDFSDKLYPPLVFNSTSVLFTREQNNWVISQLTGENTYFEAGFNGVFSIRQVKEHFGTSPSGGEEHCSRCYVEPPPGLPLQSPEGRALRLYC